MQSVMEKREIVVTKDQYEIPIVARGKLIQEAEMVPADGRYPRFVVRLFGHATQPASGSEEAVAEDLMSGAIQIEHDAEADVNNEIVVRCVGVISAHVGFPSFSFYSVFLPT